MLYWLFHSLPSENRKSPEKEREFVNWFLFWITDEIFTVFFSEALSPFKPDWWGPFLWLVSAKAAARFACGEAEAECEALSAVTLQAHDRNGSKTSDPCLLLCLLGHSVPHTVIFPMMDNILNFIIVSRLLFRNRLLNNFLLYAFHHDSYMMKTCYCC